MARDQEGEIADLKGQIEAMEHGAAKDKERWRAERDAIKAERMRVGDLEKRLRKEEEFLSSRREEIRAEKSHAMCCCRWTNRQNKRIELSIQNEGLPLAL
ncbi:MAG: hypothetical protein M1813_002177 [Trichoglossum hirsutum]|nr:MAG: hypothetical protein M1813_002177 [Trichoglossum hirsutum]